MDIEITQEEFNKWYKKNQPMTTPNTPWMTDDERDKIIRSMPLYQTHDHVNNTANDKRIKAICNAIRNAAAAHYEPLLAGEKERHNSTLDAYNDLQAQIAAKDKEVEEFKEKVKNWPEANKIASENATLKAEVERLGQKEKDWVNVNNHWIKKNDELGAELTRLKADVTGVIEYTGKRGYLLNHPDGMLYVYEYGEYVWRTAEEIYQEYLKQKQ